MIRFLIILLNYYKIETVNVLLFVYFVIYYTWYIGFLNDSAVFYLKPT